MISSRPKREDSINLLNEYIESESLKEHCKMVAFAMEAYAKKLGKPDAVVLEWWTTGLLHDLDWEKYPDEHPNRAVNHILPPLGYSTDVITAIKAHATGHGMKAGIMVASAKSYFHSLVHESDNSRFQHDVGIGLGSGSLRFEMAWPLKTFDSTPTLWVRFNPTF